MQYQYVFTAFNLSCFLVKNINAFEQLCPCHVFVMFYVQKIWVEENLDLDLDLDLWMDNIICWAQLI